MEIKICGTRNAQNIRELIELQPNYIGFVFYPPSPRFCSEVPAVEIPGNIKKVGVFVNADDDFIRVRQLEFGLDVLQFHGDETAQECQKWRGQGLQVWKAFNVHDDFDFETLNVYKDSVDAFLFDTPGPGRGGTGQSFNWSILKTYHHQVPYLLSGGISMMHADILSSDWMKELNPKGIDLNSRFELEPGLKDTLLLKSFLEKIK